jgi:hypothetical protein
MSTPTKRCRPCPEFLRVAKALPGRGGNTHMHEFGQTCRVRVLPRRASTIPTIEAKYLILRELYSPTQQAAAPSAGEIRAALKDILMSSAFSHSPMLTAFLTFVVETTLVGRGDRIKAYTVAVDGLGRRPDFNPETDAIVRVHAIRIRSALKRYYASTGAEDAIIVDLPRRRYVPTFSRRPTAPPTGLPRLLAA